VFSVEIDGVVSNEGKQGAMMSDVVHNIEVSDDWLVCAEYAEGRGTFRVSPARGGGASHEESEITNANRRGRYRRQTTANAMVDNKQGSAFTCLLLYLGFVNYDGNSK